MALQGKIAAAVNLLETATGDIEGGSVTINPTFAFDIANGTGAGQANMQWSDTRTLTTGANEDIDVSGTLTGITGAKVFVRVKAIVVYALPANTTNITVTSKATNGLPFMLALGDGFVLKPGGMFALTDPSAAGWAVTAGTADLINVANAAGASATYSILVVGANA